MDGIGMGILFRSSVISNHLLIPMIDQKISLCCSDLPHPLSIVTIPIALYENIARSATGVSFASVAWPACKVLAIRRLTKAEAFQSPVFSIQNAPVHI
jgi:hypothetical protein